MDFAKKHMEKYGWSKGKGLGKNEDGITAALKPKLKFDNSGIGHDPSEQFTNNWWERLFNSAAENINIEVDDKQVNVKVKDKDAVDISTKTSSFKCSRDDTNLEYGSFIKTAKLTQAGTETYDVSGIETTCSLPQVRMLSDDELLAYCGHRTAHKGARHGLKLGGKLSRIEKQEKLLLRKMKKVSLSDDTEKMEKKLKKLKKQRDASTNTCGPLHNEAPSTSVKKTKNKKKKNVSFNETVTKIYTADLETSFDSEVGSLRDENSSDAMTNNSGSDEGIELDHENNNDQEEDNHRSFEEARFHFSDLSKAERKKLKKKRKLEANLHSATGLFLQTLKDAPPQEEIMEDEKDTGSKKRKHYEDFESVESKRSQTDFPDRLKSKKSKKKRKKETKREAKQINCITKSLDNFCRISDCE